MKYPSFAYCSQIVYGILVETPVHIIGFIQYTNIYLFPTLFIIYKILHQLRIKNKGLGVPRQGGVLYIEKLFSYPMVFNLFKFMV
jgi:hypothetical protein